MPRWKRFASFLEYHITFFRLSTFFLKKKKTNIERNHARIFVDWKDENGSSIENSIDTQTPPDTPVEGPNVQPKEEEMIVESEIETPTQSQSQGNLSRSSEDLVEFCDSDDYDSEVSFFFFFSSLFG